MRSLLLPAVLTLVAARPGHAEPQRFRIDTEVEGVVRLEHSRLAGAGLAREGVAAGRLALSQRGRAVPLHVDDGGDDWFGPGDALEWVADRLGGQRSHYHEHSISNVYWLAVDGDGSPDLSSSAASSGASVSESQARAADLWSRRHLETDRLLVRLRGEEAEATDAWYWTKLSQIDREPFRLEVDLSSLDSESPGEVSATVALRGLSDRPADDGTPFTPDHRVELVFDGEAVAAAEWDGREEARLSFRRPAADITPGVHSLELRVPRRRGSDGRALLDVAMLDWIELAHPDSGVVDERQRRLHLGSSSSPGLVTLLGAEDSFVVYTDRGRRVLPDRSGSAATFATTAGETSFWLVPEGAAAPPAHVVADRPSNLAGEAQQADYLIVSHSSLLDAVEPLARMHRRRGLAVELVDVQDVYDEFNHGIRDPRAIRDFVSHARRHWREPAPRFLLLVGDASWDTKNETVDDRNYANWVARQLGGGQGRFAVKPATPYDTGAAANDRNLVPTWSHPGYEGHAASDNYFVSVEGDDHLPDLAVGRWPLVDPADVAGVVDKTIRYVESPPLGPWRSKLLWVSDETYAFRLRSEALAGDLGSRGWAATTAFPRPAADLEQLRAELRAELDAGHLVTHFVGHGGRFEWRIAPPDLERQTDLFTLDDLGRLAPTNRLSVVVSVACHSAPFDHPSADSIGEGFLRLPDRGAVAVIAASWRNAPGPEVSDAFARELLAAPTVGEALMRAKRRLVDREIVATYNLLGDPAVPLARPRLGAKVEPLAASSSGEPRARLILPDEALGGHLRFAWLDENGRELASRTVPAQSLVEVEGPPAARALTAYFWNERNGTDGLAALDIAPPPADPSVTRP